MAIFIVYPKGWIIYAISSLHVSGKKWSVDQAQDDDLTGNEVGTARFEEKMDYPRGVYYIYH